MGTAEAEEEDYFDEKNFENISFSFSLSNLYRKLSLIHTWIGMLLEESLAKMSAPFFSKRETISYRQCVQAI